MSFWNTVKRGFGYGLGGRIGWELGGWIWGLVVRLVMWIAGAVGLALFAVGGIPVSCSSDHAQVQKPALKQQYKAPQGR
jgi:hypothetical protein